MIFSQPRLSLNLLVRRHPYRLWLRPGYFRLPGVGSYAACAIFRVNPDEGIGSIVGYKVALLIGTVIVAFVPWISIGFL